MLLFPIQTKYFCTILGFGSFTRKGIREKKQYINTYLVDYFWNHVLLYDNCKNCCWFPNQLLWFSRNSRQYKFLMSQFWISKFIIQAILSNKYFQASSTKIEYHFWKQYPLRKYKISEANYSERCNFSEIQIFCFQYIIS